MALKIVGSPGYVQCLRDSHGPLVFPTSADLLMVWGGSPPRWLGHAPGMQHTKPGNSQFAMENGPFKDEYDELPNQQMVQNDTGRMIH